MNPFAKESAFYSLMSNGFSQAVGNFIQKQQSNFSAVGLALGIVASLGLANPVAAQGLHDHCDHAKPGVHESYLKVLGEKSPSWVIKSQQVHGSADPAAQTDHSSSLSNTVVSSSGDVHASSTESPFIDLPDHVVWDPTDPYVKKESSRAPLSQDKSEFLAKFETVLQEVLDKSCQFNESQSRAEHNEQCADALASDQDFSTLQTLPVTVRALDAKMMGSQGKAPVFVLNTEMNPYLDQVESRNAFVDQRLHSITSDPAFDVGVAIRIGSVDDSTKESSERGIFINTLGFYDQVRDGHIKTEDELKRAVAFLIYHEAAHLEMDMSQVDLSAVNVETLADEMAVRRMVNEGYDLSDPLNTKVLLGFHSSIAGASDAQYQESFEYFLKNASDYSFAEIAETVKLVTAHPVGEHQHGDYFTRGLLSYLNAADQIERNENGTGLPGWGNVSVPGAAPSYAEAMNDSVEPPSVRPGG